MFIKLIFILLAIINPFSAVQSNEVLTEVPNDYITVITCEVGNIYETERIKSEIEFTLYSDDVICINVDDNTDYIIPDVPLFDGLYEITFEHDDIVKVLQYTEF